MTLCKFLRQILNLNRKSIILEHLTYQKKIFNQNEFNNCEAIKVFISLRAINSLFSNQKSSRKQSN